jgi:hypothetical protein
VSIDEALCPPVAGGADPQQKQGTDAFQQKGGEDDVNVLTCSSTDALLREALAANNASEPSGSLSPAFRTQEILADALHGAINHTLEKLPSLQQKRSPREISMIRGGHRNMSSALPPIGANATDANREAGEIGGPHANMQPKASLAELHLDRAHRGNRTPLYLRMQRDCEAQEQQQRAAALQLRLAQLAVHAVPPAKSARRKSSKSRGVSAKKKAKLPAGKRRRVKAQIDAAYANRGQVETKPTPCAEVPPEADQHQCSDEAQSSKPKGAFASGHSPVAAIATEQGTVGLRINCFDGEVTP